MHKYQATVCRGYPGEATGYASPPVENPSYIAFKEYKDIPETVPLDFTKDDVTWVASKISSTAGALGAEAIELHNWLLCFGCASEELRVVVERMGDWMAKPSSPWPFIHNHQATCQ